MVPSAVIIPAMFCTRACLIPILLSPLFMSGQASPVSAPADSQPSLFTVEIVHAVPAEYPSEALATNIQGSVSVSVVISPSGDVERTEVADGDPILQKAAQAAARQFRFKAVKGDPSPPAKYWAELVFDFRLSNNIRTTALPSGQTVMGQLVHSEEFPSVIRVSETAMQASRLKTFAPAFPRDAIGSIGSGLVVLKVLIGTDGKVQGLDALSGPQKFVPAAEEAVRRWEYQPYLFMGEAVPVETQVTVKFEVGSKPLPADEMQWMLDHPQSMLTDLDIHEDSPLYPEAAKQQGRHGRGVVVAKVDPNGMLSDFQVIRADDLFKGAALEAAKRQKQVAPTAGDVHQQVQMTFFVNFVK